MDDLTINMLTAIISFVQFIIVVLGAIWAYFRFRKENPLPPRIEFMNHPFGFS